MKHAHIPSRPLSAVLLPAILAMLSACGGGGEGGSEAAETAAASDGATVSALALRKSKLPAPSPSPTVLTPSASSAGLTDAQRTAAATATAQSATNICGAIRPFYWEIGNSAGKTTSGSIKSATSTTTYTSTASISLASASKWIYGSYVAQRLNGALSPQDIKYMTMRSGYNNLSSCPQTGTVDSCLSYAGNGAYNAAADGKFYYDGGHFEKHASLSGLGAMNGKMLTSTIMGQLGTDIKLAYSQPLLAGGAYGTPDAYALFLRKVLKKELKISGLLGTNAACTNKATCPSGTALSAPIPPNESWHYSIGHWVEDDPKVGDGAFSSPGAFGFYPWIDSSRTYYGVVARMVSGGAVTSMQCGRLIRKAWLTGAAL